MRPVAVVPAVAALVVAGCLAGAPASAAPVAASPRFCTESATLVRDLLNFGHVPRTVTAISHALTHVDGELKQLAIDAPNAHDRGTIVTLLAEFAKLRSIVVTDPNGTKAADRAFLKTFATAATRQGALLGAEVKAACP